MRIRSSPSRAGGGPAESGAAIPAGGHDRTAGNRIPPAGDDAGPPASDVVLLDLVRSGSAAAADGLRARHAAAARTLACLLPAGPARADEVVAESFRHVLDALGQGGGPTGAFRPQLLAVVVAVGSRAAGSGPSPAGSALRVPGPGCSLVRAADAAPGAAVAVRAFAALPEHCSTAMWHAEVELADPAAIAPLLGMTGPGCAALITCARAVLRTTYLQIYGSGRPSADCRLAADDLAAWVHQALTRSEKAAVDQHLRSCGCCWRAYSDLIDIGGALRGSLAPLVLGSVAAAYCARMAGLPASDVGY